MSSCGPTALQQAIDKARTCIGDVGTESYCTEVQVVTRVWDGGAIGLGTVVETIVTLAPRPRVRAESPRYRYTEQGKNPEGDRRVDGVSLGYTRGDLEDEGLGSGVERFYLLNDQPYRLTSEPVCAGLGWYFRVSRMRARPPVPLPAPAFAVSPAGLEAISADGSIAVSALG